MTTQASWQRTARREESVTFVRTYLAIATAIALILGGCASGQEQIEAGPAPSARSAPSGTANDVGSARSAPDGTANDVGAAPRLTPLRADVPDLPATKDLEDRAQQVPVENRILVYPDLFRVPASYPGPEEYLLFVVFNVSDGTLAGAYVPGLGVIDRAVYDDPSTDFEDLAREKFGDEQYAKMLRAEQGASEGG